MKTKDYDKLDRLIKSRGFKIYNEFLDDQVRDLMNKLMDIDSEANKQQFSRHDLYRMLIRILISYKQQPLRELDEIISENQMRPEVQDMLEDTKKYIREIVFGREGHA